MQWLDAPLENFASSTEVTLHISSVWTVVKCFSLSLKLILSALSPRTFQQSRVERVYETDAATCIGRRKFYERGVLM